MRPPRNPLPSPRSKTSSAGFSLVELLVALVFTSILMAGMAKVFQSSLGTFVAASENVSSGRRNRMAMDLLFDDLNLAGMVPSDLFDFPPTDSTNPPFRVTPNVAYANTDVPTAEAKTDQLDFYYDEVLPFDAKLGTALANTSKQVGAGGQLGDNASFTLTFRDADQAKQAASAFSTHGLSILFRSSGYTYPLKKAEQDGTSATVNAEIKSDSAYAGSGGASGATFATGATSGSGVTLMRPGVYVRYSIKAKALDPANAAARTPCLMREEVTYKNVSSSTTPFNAPEASTIVAENVVGFKVLLSGDGGKTWAGGVSTHTTWADITGPATGATTPTLNWQLKSGTVKARPNMNSTASHPFWFREIPVLVRLDVTTRTMTKRSEHAKTVNTADYKTQTQSLVLAPRHSGLAYQPLTL